MASGDGHGPVVDADDDLPLYPTVVKTSPSSPPTASSAAKHTSRKKTKYVSVEHVEEAETSVAESAVELDADYPSSSQSSHCLRNRKRRLLLAGMLTAAMMTTWLLLSGSYMFPAAPAAPPPSAPWPGPPPPTGPPQAPPQAPPPSTVSSKKAAELNERFKRGTPSSSLLEAGILVHTFDFHLTKEPWVPLGPNGGASDRVSASLFNQRLPYIFKGHGFGFVLEPTIANDTLWCAWSLDAGTTGKSPCDRMCRVPSDAHQLTPDWYCPWSPQHLMYMLQQHELRHGAAFNNGWHNEVILRAASYSAAMPRIVEAFFATSDETHASARVVRARFAQRFGLVGNALPPLLRLNLSHATPFEAVETGVEHNVEGQRVIDGLNHRFANGRPSEDPAHAGVFFRGLDALTRAHAEDPWNAYFPHSEVLSDRVSGCIINARLPYLFMRTPWPPGPYDAEPPGPQVGAGGFIVRSAIVKQAMLCSYSHDASTIDDRSQRGCGRGDAHPSTQLNEMLEVHEFRAAGFCVPDGNINNCYNEVLLSHHVWNREMPHLVEAIAYPRGSARAEHEARLTHALFTEHFRVQVPLVEITLREHSQNNTLNPQPFSLAAP